ncbi:MAG: hypothetical protein ACYCSR_16065 [Thiomonas sp.]
MKTLQPLLHRAGSGVFMDTSSLFIFAIELIAAGSAATFLLADSIPVKADEPSQELPRLAGSVAQAVGRGICKHSTGQ